jgi:signal transduction histidine kinase
MRAGLRSRLKAVLIAAVCMGLTILLRFGVGDWLGHRIPLLLPMIVAIFAATWYGGSAAGLIATVLGLGLGVVLFQGRANPSEAVVLYRLRLILFGVEAVLITVSLEAMHRARQRLVQKKAELEKEVQDRVHAEQKLVLAAQRKNQFLATLAHELRNPLSPLRNSLEIIERNHADPQALAEEAKRHPPRYQTELGNGGGKRDLWREPTFSYQPFVYASGLDSNASRTCRKSKPEETQALKPAGSGSRCSTVL